MGFAVFLANCTNGHRMLQCCVCLWCYVLRPYTWTPHTHTHVTLGKVG